MGQSVTAWLRKQFLLLFSFEKFLIWTNISVMLSNMACWQVLVSARFLWLLFLFVSSVFNLIPKGLSQNLTYFCSLPLPSLTLIFFYDNALLWRHFPFLPGCTYNHQHAAADPAAPASAVPGAADEAAATSLSFLLFLLRWSASPWWPHRRPWFRQINPGPLHRPTPGPGPYWHTAHQRAAVFAQRLQHLPSLWVQDENNTRS